MLEWWFIRQFAYSLQAFFCKVLFTIQSISKLTFANNHLCGSPNLLTDTRPSNIARFYTGRKATISLAWPRLACDHILDMSLLLVVHQVYPIGDFDNPISTLVQSQSTRLQNRPFHARQRMKDFVELLEIAPCIQNE
jgi:hypothetical protein